MYKSLNVPYILIYFILELKFEFGLTRFCTDFNYLQMVLEKDVNSSQIESGLPPSDDVGTVNEVTPLLRNTLDDDDDDDNNQKAFRHRKRGLYWRCFVLFAGLFLLVVAFTILQLGVLNQYVYYAFQKKYFPNITFNTGEQQKSHCHTNTTASSNTDDEIRNKVQVAASSFMVYTSLALYIPPIFGNFFFMTLSDTYGRKPFILLPVFGSLLRSALFVVGIYYELDIYWFLGFLFIEGVTGGIFCHVTAAFSYIADITEKGDKRIFLMVIAEVMAAFGGLLGTLSSGYLIRAFGFTIPSFIATMSLLLSTLLLAVFLPESLPAEFKPRSQNINCFNKFKGVWAFYTSNKYGEGTQWRYVCSILILICVQIGMHGRSNVETLYQLNEPFCWNSVLLGWFAGVRILSSYIIGLVLIRVLQCCVSVEFIALVGAASHMASFVLESFAEKNFELFLGKYYRYSKTLLVKIK